MYFPQLDSVYELESDPREDAKLSFSETEVKHTSHCNHPAQDDHHVERVSIFADGPSKHPAFRNSTRVSE